MWLLKKIGGLTRTILIAFGEAMIDTPKRLEKEEYCRYKHSGSPVSFEEWKETSKAIEYSEER